MADKNYVGDIGVQFQINCVSDITGDSTHQIKVRKPSGVEVTWNAIVSNGKYLYYTVQSGDFDEAGVYKAQALLDGPILGETFEFTIFNKYN